MYIIQTQGEGLGKVLMSVLVTHRGMDEGVIVNVKWGRGEKHC